MFNVVLQANTTQSGTICQIVKLYRAVRSEVKPTDIYFYELKLEATDANLMHVNLPPVEFYLKINLNVLCWLAVLFMIFHSKLMVNYKWCCTLAVLHFMQLVHSR